MTYALLDYTNHFSIHPNGTVYITEALDAETTPDTIEITVSATDSGVPAQQSTAILRIRVTDLNDVAPRFTQTAPLINVPENADIG